MRQQPGEIHWNANTIRQHRSCKLKQRLTIGTVFCFKIDSYLLKGGTLFRLSLLCQLIFLFRNCVLAVCPNQIQQSVRPTTQPAACR